MKKPKQLYKVDAGILGVHETWAVSYKQALSNVRHRMRERGVSEYSLHCEQWTLRKEEACTIWR